MVTSLCNSKKKFQNITVAVDEDRIHGINLLLKNDDLSMKNEQQTKKTILLDDAFQHRRVKPGLSILLLDYTMDFKTQNSKLRTQNYVLPTGRLREFRSGYKRADIIIVTKTPENLSLKIRQKIIETIRPLSHQKIYFSFIKYYPLKPLNSNSSFSILNSQFSILLFAGIANPDIFIHKVIEIYNKNSPLSTPNSILFNDHHNYSIEDILMIKSKFLKIKEENKIIITTEKDSMRLHKPVLLNILKDLPVYYLPIETEFHKEDKQAFNDSILKFLI